MKSLLFILAGCLPYTVIYGQADTIPRNIYLKTVVTDLSGRSHPGYLHSVIDSAIRFTTFKSRTYASTVQKRDISEIAFSEIGTLSVKRQHSGGRGAAFGALIGAGAGALIGLISYKDPGPDAWLDFGPGLDAFAGFAIGSISGSIVGLGIGLSAKKTFIIEGRQDRYRQMQNNLHKRLARKKTAR